MQHNLDANFLGRLWRHKRFWITWRGINCSVKIQEINVIFSTFHTFIFFNKCRQFEFVNDIDLKS